MDINHSTTNSNNQVNINDYHLFLNDTIPQFQSQKRETNQPLISIKLQETQYRALIDTKAAISLTGINLCKKISMEQIFQLNKPLIGY